MVGAFPDGSTRLSHKGRTVFRGVGLGGFAESVVVHETGAIPLPTDMPLDLACVLGCALQTGVGAVLNTARVEAGATVVVVGLGGIGVSIVMGAGIAGASQVIGVDPVPERRDRARHFGATMTIDPAKDDVVPAVMSTTSGIGADYAFDAVGNASLVEMCLQAIRDGGTTIMVGVPGLEQQVRVPGLGFTVTEKKLQGCFLGSCNPWRDVPLLVDLWRAGRLDLDAFVTARRPLDQINDAFADLKGGVGLRTVVSL
jgi:Zn-dependent alcohol dehydrogenase